MGGSLPVPQRPGDVVWYTHSGRAGEANNGVYAGHLRWNNQPGVFARLKELVDGHDLKRARRGIPRQERPLARGRR